MITYREYIDRDFDKIVRIVSNAWGYSDFMPESIANSMAELDLLPCIRQHTFSQVVEDEGKIVGFILGNISTNFIDSEYDERIKNNIENLKNTEEGLIAYDIRKNMKSINEKLLANSGKDYKSELSFFAIDEEYRGKGIGKELLCRFIKYLKKNNISEFYLYTDTSSDYKFYEHFGFNKKGEQYMELPFKKNKGIYFYIYEKQI